MRIFFNIFLLFSHVFIQRAFSDSETIKCAISDSGVLIVEQLKEGVVCKWSAEPDFLNYDVIRVLENMPSGVAIDDSTPSVYFSELVNNVLRFYSLDLYKDDLMGRWQGHPIDRLSLRGSYVLNGDFVGFCFIQNILTVIEVVNNKIVIVQKVGKDWVKTSSADLKGNIVSWDSDRSSLFFLVDQGGFPSILNYKLDYWFSHLISRPIPDQITHLGDRIGIIRKDHRSKNIAVTIFDEKKEYSFVDITPKDSFFILKGAGKGLLMYLKNESFYRWSWPGGISNGEEKRVLRNIFWETVWQVVVGILVLLGGVILLIFFKSTREELLPLPVEHVAISPIIRFLSLIIDLLPMSFFIAKSGDLSLGDLLYSPSLGISLEESLPWILIVSGTALFSFFCEVLFGATIGKKLFGISVFSFAGGRLSARNHLYRHVVRSLMLLLPVLCLTIFFSVHGRTVADVLSGAVVVKKKV